MLFSILSKHLEFLDLIPFLYYKEAYMKQCPSKASFFISNDIPYMCLTQLQLWEDITHNFYHHLHKATLNIKQSVNNTLISREDIAQNC